VGGPQDKTPEEVLRIVNIIVKKIRLTHAHQPIFLIAVTPTSSRFHAWETIQQLNSRLASYCQEQESMHFVETAAPFLDPSTGKPRDELFVSDRLHLNSDGYQVWAKILREQFAEVLLAPTAE
jgi:lysophospholipase L1-like esterase